MSKNAFDSVGRHFLFIRTISVRSALQAGRSAAAKLLG
jgi:hypothetical protein